MHRAVGVIIYLNAVRASGSASAANAASVDGAVENDASFESDSSTEGGVGEGVDDEGGALDKSVVEQVRALARRERE